MPGWGQIDAGVEIVESSVFLPNVLAIYLMGSLFGSRGGWGVEGVALFSYAVIVGEER